MRATLAFFLFDRRWLLSAPFGSRSMRGDNRSAVSALSDAVREKTIADRWRRSGDGADAGQKWVSRDEDEIVYDRCRAEPVTKGKAISPLKTPHYDSKCSSHSAVRSLSLCVGSPEVSARPNWVRWNTEAGNDRRCSSQLSEKMQTIAINWR